MEAACQGMMMYAAVTTRINNKCAPAVSGSIPQVFPPEMLGWRKQKRHHGPLTFNH